MQVTDTTTIQARDFPVAVAVDVRRYAPSQGIRVGSALAGAWQFRASVVAALECGQRIDASWLRAELERAGIPIGRAL